MADYKERIIEAKKILDERLKKGKLTKEDAIKRAEQFYESNKEEFVEKVLENFITNMEQFKQTSAGYYKEIGQPELYNNDYNKAFEEKLVSLVKAGLKEKLPDFCKYKISIIRTLYGNHININISIEE